MRTGILEGVFGSNTPAAFLLNRPATVGRDAPRMERGSEELVCVLDIRI
jgi:hypothetical protein